MIREVVRPQTQSFTINIPKEYLNREIEILIFPVNPEKEFSNQKTDIIKKTSGLLSHRKVDPIEWQKKIRDQWDNRP